MYLYLERVKEITVQHWKGKKGKFQIFKLTANIMERSFGACLTGSQYISTALHFDK